MRECNVHVNRLKKRGWTLWLALILQASFVHAADQYWVYTVRPGDSIWKLTDKYCTSVRYWRVIQSLNGIQLDRQIPPGTKLRFPLGILKNNPATALVTQVQGKASLVRAGTQAMVALTPQTALRTGDRIETADASNVTLVFADGSELLVLEESEVIMDTLSAWSTTGMVDTRIRLQGGRVDTSVEPSEGPGSRYEIISPAAIAAVRGTHFRAAADKQEPVTRNEVTKGRVAVGDAATTQDIAAGFGIVTEKGKAPSTPQKLLPPPRLAENQKSQRQLPLRFTWAELPAASGYRFQIGPNESFETLYADERVSEPVAEWPDLLDGRYALRVRGIDEFGLEGLDAVASFAVDARPLAPVLVDLVEGIRIQTSQPHFSWKKAEGVHRYYFELARDSDFERVVLKQELEGTSFETPAPLTRDSYYWRVASISQDGSRGPFSSPQHFIYRPPLEAPAFSVQPVIEKHHISFEWRAVPDARGYRFQLADNSAFTEIVTDRTVSEAHIKLLRPMSGDYYARVRAVGTDEESGAYSQVQHTEVPPASYWPLLLLIIPVILLL